MTGSTIGRPRKVTDEQVRLILEWHEARKQVRTLKQLACDLGLAPATVYTVIRRGPYKQACPSTRER